MLWHSKNNPLFNHPVASKTLILPFNYTLIKLMVKIYPKFKTSITHIIYRVHSHVQNFIIRIYKALSLLQEPFQNN